jgi:hypothetical protein
VPTTEAPTAEQVREHINSLIALGATREDFRRTLRVGSRFLHQTFTGQTELLGTHHRRVALSCTYEQLVGSRPNVPRHTGPKVDGAEAVAHIGRHMATGISLAALALKLGISSTITYRMSKAYREGLPYNTHPSVVEAVLAVPVPSELEPRARVPAIGTYRRVKALFCSGWALGVQIKWVEENVKRNIGEKILRCALTRTPAEVSLELREAVRSMYAQLAEIPRPPDKRRMALDQITEFGDDFEQQYPYQWDELDMDDPEAVPAPIVPEWHVDTYLVDEVVKGTRPWRHLESTFEQELVVRTLHQRMNLAEVANFLDADPALVVRRSGTVQ